MEFITNMVAFFLFATCMFSFSGDYIPNFGPMSLVDRENIDAHYNKLSREEKEYFDFEFPDQGEDYYGSIQLNFSDNVKSFCTTCANVVINQLNDGERPSVELESAIRRCRNVSLSNIVHLVGRIDDRKKQNSKAWWNDQREKFHKQFEKYVALSEVKAQFAIVQEAAKDVVKDSPVFAQKPLSELEVVKLAQKFIYMGLSKAFRLKLNNKTELEKWQDYISDSVHAELKKIKKEQNPLLLQKSLAHIDELKKKEGNYIQFRCELAKKTFNIVTSSMRNMFFFDDVLCRGATTFSFKDYVKSFLTQPDNEDYDGVGGYFPSRFRRRGHLIWPFRTHNVLLEELLVCKKMGKCDIKQSRIDNYKKFVDANFELHRKNPRLPSWNSELKRLNADEVDKEVKILLPKLGAALKELKREYGILIKPTFSDDRY